MIGSTYQKNLFVEFIFTKNLIYLSLHCYKEINQTNKNTTAMTLKKNIATSEEGFLFNPGTGDSFSTNTIGGDIIALLKENRPQKEIIEIICKKYDVDENQFERDLDDFESQLKDYSIID